MRASVRAFLSQIIDYAGLFPPAKLPMEEALRLYLHAKKTSPHRWMLGRFVCPTVRLRELLVLAKGHPDASLLSLSVLGTQSSSISEWSKHLLRDYGAIQEFRRAWNDDTIIDCFEVALAQDLSSVSTDELLVQAACQPPPKNVRGFLEVPIALTWDREVNRLVYQLMTINADPDYDRGPIGLKLRCGGTAANSFPSNEQIAFFIHACRAYSLSWKATAGLHHPRRHWDAALQIWHHGFLNVFGAGVLTWTNSLTEADLVAILSDRDGEHFHFDDDTFAWKQWSCKTAQIAEARANFATSFGCCSFEEPCADLIAMGLIDALD